MIHKALYRTVRFLGPARLMCPSLSGYDGNLGHKVMKTILIQPEALYKY